MITFINESLIKIEEIKKENASKKSKKIYSVISNAKILQRAVDKKDAEKTYIKKITAPVADIIADDDTYQSNRTTFVSTKRRKNDNVKIITDPNAPFDSHCIVVAFPYNGILKPFPEKMPFRIIRAFIAHSHFYTISFEGKKYNKCLYMVIVPNMQLLEETAKFKKDKLYFKIDSFEPVKPIEGQDETTDKKCYQRSLSIQVTKDGVSSRIMERVVDFVDTKEFDGKPIWNLFKFTPKPKRKPAKGRNRFTKNKGGDNNGKKYYKTKEKTNAGYKKEHSDSRPHRSNNFTRNDKNSTDRKSASSSIDKMIKHALSSSQSEHSSDAHRSKANGGKRR